MYFKTTITEINGEQEYSSHYLIIADNYEQALEKARTMASQWYGEADGTYGKYDEEEDDWSFFGGEIIVTADDPTETTLEDFLEHIKRLYVIE